MTKLTFFEYLFKKMLKSISTYITGIIALIPIWAVTISSVSKGTISESTLSMLAFFTFPIMIIFMSFKASQVFRDEIENKTLLTIQAKPITRKQMVYQGLMTINVFSFILAIVGGFIPFVIGAIVTGPSMIGHGALIALTEMLLLGIISVIALLLSISMGGKAFIGTMIGGFVAGFYVLFGITMFINISGSRTAKVSNYMRSNTTMGVQHQDNENRYTVTISNVSKIEDAQAIYDKFNDVNKENLSTISAWFNPAVHWTTMFAATSKEFAGNLEHNDIDVWYLLTSKAKVHMLTARPTAFPADGSKITFDIEVEEGTLVPLWYPYLLWVAIAGISVPFAIRSITRKNIA